MLPLRFATTDCFTALVCCSAFICESERLLRRTLSVDGFCFFMFKTDQRAEKVMNIQTLPKLGVRTPPSVAWAAFALALAALAWA